MEPRVTRGKAISWPPAGATDDPPSPPPFKNRPYYSSDQRNGAILEKAKTMGIV